MEEEKIIKYTVDIDTMDKLIPSDLFTLKLFDPRYIISTINPYEIKVLFGKKQEKVLICSDHKQSYYILNPYISKNFKNVHYIKLLNCIFPRYYNVYEENGELKKRDIYNQRFIYLVIDINQNTNIYSTNQKLGNNYIKLKVLNTNIYNDFVVLQPISGNCQFHFKSGQLKNIDTMVIKLFDDNMEPLILNFSHLWNGENIDKLNKFIKDHSVNYNFEIGCYELNMRNTNDY